MVDRGQLGGAALRAVAMVLDLGECNLGGVGRDSDRGGRHLGLQLRHRKWLAAQEAMMPFYRGQKVVYIGPDFRNHPLTTMYRVNVPIPGEVYRTRSGQLFWEDTSGYLLEGIVNGISPLIGQEMLIDEHLLRPVAEIKDQAFFTAGAPADTKGLDNRHKRKQKVWQIKLPHGFAELQLARGLEDLERYRAKWEQARKATS